jgi:hypothetical protein
MTDEVKNECQNWHDYECPHCAYLKGQIAVLRAQIANPGEHERHLDKLASLLRDFWTLSEKWPRWAYKSREQELVRLSIIALRDCGREYKP